MNCGKHFGDIFFDEPTHTYTDSKGTEYTSATNWIKQFQEEKDWEAIRMKKAKKEGIPYEELKEKADYVSNYATNLGTQVHSVMELRMAKEELQL